MKQRHIGNEPKVIQKKAEQVGENPKKTDTEKRRDKYKSNSKRKEFEPYN